MKFLNWSFCLLGILAQQGCCVKVRYDGDQVLKINPQTSNHAQYLQQLAKEWRLDLWKPDLIEEIHADGQIHVQIPFPRTQQMKENLQKQGIPFKIMINDVQKLIDDNGENNYTPRKVSLEDYNYTIYHPMEEIYTWMEDIEAKHSNLVSKHNMGDTYEGRPIYYFKIGWPSNQKKKIFFMDCGIHAREWIAVSFCQWFVKEILLRHESDAFLTKVLQKVDFYIVPVFNVDGYIYSWTTDRLWRKNRTPHDNGDCFGVDLNRNFDAHWCETGADPFCDSFTYCGPSVASEPETKAMISLIETHKTEILGYLNMHSFGQLILFPYGYTFNISENIDELANFTSGAAIDWITTLNVPLTYVYELRDGGEYGFELPPDQIEPTCLETMDGVMSMVEYVYENYVENSAVVVTSMYLNVLVSCFVCIFCSLIH
ncbi:carboxypeptidase O-like [Pelodytes ibericus]